MRSWKLGTVGIQYVPTVRTVGTQYVPSVQTVGTQYVPTVQTVGTECVPTAWTVGTYRSTINTSFEYIFSFILTQRFSHETHQSILLK